MYPVQGRIAGVASYIAGKLLSDVFQQQVLDQERRDGKHNCRREKPGPARDLKAIRAIGVIHNAAESRALPMP
jgi:hypothetical protein